MTTQVDRPWTPEQHRKLLEALEKDPGRRVFERLIAAQPPRFAMSTLTGALELLPPLEEYAELYRQLAEYQRWLIRELIRALGGNPEEIDRWH